MSMTFEKMHRLDAQLHTMSEQAVWLDRTIDALEVEARSPELLRERFIIASRPGALRARLAR